MNCKDIFSFLANIVFCRGQNITRTPQVPRSEEQRPAPLAAWSVIRGLVALAARDLGAHCRVASVKVVTAPLESGPRFWAVRDKGPRVTGFREGITVPIHLCYQQALDEYDAGHVLPKHVLVEKNELLCRIGIWLENSSCHLGTFSQAILAQVRITHRCPGR